jgi:hypothetical protein
MAQGELSLQVVVAVLEELPVELAATVVALELPDLLVVL